MAVIALASAKGSPGVSVSALALGLSWPGRVLIAECDPAGGDAMSGVLGGQLPADRGIAELAVLQARGRLHTDFADQLVVLDPPHQRRLLLPGVASPVSAGGVAAIGETIADFLVGLEDAEPGYDVIADCGRLCAPNTLWPLVYRADVLVLVVRGTLPSLAHAQNTVGELRDRFGQRRMSLDGLRLLVIDDGPYTAEAGKRLGVPVVGVLPYRPRTARRLSFGGGSVHRGHRLIRAAELLHQPLRKVITSRQAAAGPLPEAGRV